MAIEQTGSSRRFSGMGTGNTGTVASDIVVPADATKAIVVVSAFDSQNNPFAAMTLTKGGVDTAMVKGASADYDQNGWQGAMFYLDNPDTGSGKTLKWDWAGTNAILEHPAMSIEFWKGCADGIRDGDGFHVAASPSSVNYVCPTLTAQSGDKIVVACPTFSPATPSGLTAVGWTVDEILHDQVSSWGAIIRGHADPTGNHDVRLNGGSNIDDGGIMGMVLTPSEGGGEIPGGIIRPMRRGR